MHQITLTQINYVSFESSHGGDIPQDEARISNAITNVISSISNPSSVDSEKFRNTILSSLPKPDIPSDNMGYSQGYQPLDFVNTSHSLSNQFTALKPEYSRDVIPYCVPTSASFDTNLDGAMDSSAFSRNHTTKVCEWPGCNKFPQGPTKYCISHGGGHRCQFPGCLKGARDKKWCTAHGGGKRCEVDGCIKAAVGSSSLCTAVRIINHVTKMLNGKILTINHHKPLKSTVVVEDARLPVVSKLLNHLPYFASR